VLANWISARIRPGPLGWREVQTALHAKAKEMPTYRFYALYDKLYREDILAHAWGQVCRAISALTSRRRLLLDAQLQVAELNRALTGWANYFCLGPVGKAYRAIDAHAVERLRRWLCKKDKTPGRGGAHVSPTSTFITSWGSSVCRRLRATFHAA
jgi:hypothetical protein